MIAELKRIDSGDYGTLGVLYMPGLTVCTIELPWRENRENVSCIPIGVYDAEPHKSPSHGNVYRLLNVPKRSDILIHVGNFAGDTGKGYRTDSEGCILPGLYHDSLSNQTAVVDSGKALRRLKAAIGQQTFTLSITEVR
jgi:hypothetical protein